MTKREVKMAIQAPSFRPAVIGTHYRVAPIQIGDVYALMQYAKTGLRHAGADPRREGYAAAW